MFPYMIASKKIKNDIQIIQNRAIRSIFKVSKFTSQKIMNAISNLTPIDQRILKLCSSFLTKNYNHNTHIKELIDKYSILSITKQSILYQMHLMNCFLYAERRAFHLQADDFH
ncbi:hypothetical protein BpHYR1_005273 [Brachionus plicatilis]|uniref:RNA-directed DNA polymerase from mobile element jockey-like n=1 Tax=Brachionus plicatilis TaxID=10195 RepID=A0A3M7RHT1_BRAPC|nr:hypothetical protein BpHYR1_005273 [Brachionus plicatilis]